MFKGEIIEFMKAYKIEVLVIDFEDIGEKEIGDTLANLRDLSVDVKSIKSVEIGEWRDDHPLNKKETSDNEYARLFPDPSKKDYEKNNG